MLSPCRVSFLHSTAKKLRTRCSWIEHSFVLTIANEVYLTAHKNISHASKNISHAHKNISHASKMVPNAFKWLKKYVSNWPGRTYVNSALTYHLHNSHLQFPTPLPPPTVPLLRRFDAMDTINNFEVLNINILISLCSN